MSGQTNWPPAKSAIPFEIISRSSYTSKDIIFFLSGLCDKTSEKIYYDVTTFAMCFRRMNGTHQVGCTCELAFRKFPDIAFHTYLSKLWKKNKKKKKTKRNALIINCKQICMTKVPRIQSLVLCYFFFFWLFLTSSWEGRKCWNIALHWGWRRSGLAHPK